jgi:citrate synthase
MTSSTNSNDGRDRGHTINPDNAATDPRAAATQEQVHADHDALQESARRVEASVPDNVRDANQAATDSAAAATQDQVKADHDALQESARRVEASVPADVRDTPVQPAENDRNRR